MLIRDNASNGKKACELFGVRDFGCIAHSLHLVTGPFLLQKKTQEEEEEDDDIDEDNDDDVAEFNVEELAGVLHESDERMQDVAKKMARIAQKFRTVVRYIKKSTIAKEYIHKLQRVNHR